MLHARTGEKPCCVDLLFPHLKDVQIDGVTEAHNGVVVTPRTRTTQANRHHCGKTTSRRTGAACTTRRRVADRC